MLRPLDGTGLGSLPPTTESPHIEWWIPPRLIGQGIGGSGDAASSFIARTKMLGLKRLKDGAGLSADAAGPRRGLGDGVYPCGGAEC